MLEADYVIVGAGTAGCLLANRLVRHGTVLLLEAGGSDAHPFVRVPLGYLRAIGHRRLDWGWFTEPEPGLHGRQLRYPRGRVLGGCSSINGMIAMRGQARDYAAWAGLTGDSEWDWPQVLPDFIAHEDHHGGANDLHGAGGEWRIERQRLHWPILDAVRTAAQQMGVPACDDFNRGDNEGVGYFEVNQRRGHRWNAAQAFLDPVRHHPNLRLVSGAQVERLLLTEQEPLCCIGVEGLLKGERVRWRARREVLLAAGAIGSPLLLQRSGVGPGPLLQSLGIPLRHELPGVGANLQDHLQLRTVWQVQGVETLNTRGRRWSARAGMLWDFLVHRRGPLTMAPSQLGLFTRSEPTQPHADLEFHIQPLSLPAFGEPLDGFDAITLSVCHLNPTSRGSVQLSSPAPEAPPRIAPAYLSTAEDRRIAALALRCARRLAAQAALAPYRPQELKPGAAIVSDEGLADAAGSIGTTIFHPVGTTRMGRADDSAAVLDSRLRVRGVQSLRVIDAGAMPLIPSGNTATPTLMLAEKGARFVIAEAKEKPA